MISAIVVNHNGAAHLGRCLGSLGPPRDGLEILLVDNASDDGSLELVRSEFPHVSVLPQTSNLGFGAANNLAAAAATGTAFLLLNADAWLEADALALLEARLSEDPRVGLVAPQLRYPDGGRQFAWSPQRSIVGEAVQLLRNPFESTPWVHARAARALARFAGPTWFTAACVLLRADAYRRVGGFDEHFFMYFEDVDLCHRLREAGWRLVDEPRAIAGHHGGLERAAGSDELYRPSQIRFYRKHRPVWEQRWIERRLRRRFGAEAVERWASGAGRAS
jgi:GT2 family glycosyltransferase